MNALLRFEWLDAEAVVERLGWVLVHSLWQFALVALLAGVTVRAMRRSSSALRYGLLVTAMAVSVLAPIASWILMPSDAPSDHSANRAASARGHESSAATGPGSEAIRLASKPDIAGDAEIEGPIPDLAPSSVASELLPASPLSAGNTQATLSWSVRAKTVLQPWLAWIVASWSLGVVLCSARPLLGWHTLRRLKRVGVLPVSDEVLASLHLASERLGLRSSVQLLQSTLAQVPIVVGYFRPVILLPVSLMTRIPAAQLEAILTHELAHIRRHDFIVNLLQTLVETLFFYHPAVWWLSRQIRVEREHCCDDLVVKLLDNRVEYGRALVAIEQLRGRNSVLALGANDGSLLSRVRRIVGFNSAGDDALAVERWPAALLGLALIAATFLLTLNWNLSAKDQIGESVGPEEKPQAAKYSATLPNGDTVELVHLTTASLSVPAQHKRVWWKGDGTLDVEANAQESDPEFINRAPLNARVVAVRATTKAGEPSLCLKTLPAADTRHQVYSDSKDQQGHSVRTFSADFGPIGSEKSASLRVGVAPDPWGDWQQISPTGELLDELDELRPHWSNYQQIKVLRAGTVFHTLTPPAGTFVDPNHWVDTDVVLESPRNHDELFSFEFRAVSTDGKTHMAIDVSYSQTDEPRRTTFHLNGDVFRDRLARFEYRLRPYRHWVTFENVSLQPGQQTEVQVKVESQPPPVQPPGAKSDAWGPESNGLRSRLVAVPTTANDESPDLTKSETAFSRGENVTLAVELQNVSNKAVTLIGVRHDAKGQPRFEGKLAPEIFAPYLFELEFTDANGQPVPRTSRDFLPMHHRLNGALTHEIAPGKSLVVLLRPSKFYPPMDHHLPPGSYRAKIRYRGPGDMALATFQEHFPNEPRANAWSGEVTSNEVEFTVANDPSAPKPPSLVWGPVKDGLQAAVEFRQPPDAPPSNDPPGTFLTKPYVSTIFHVKNVSDRTIKFVSETGRQLDPATATDEVGKTIRLEGAWFSGLPILVRWTLKPGDVAELHAITSGISLLKKPGKYTVRYDINFGSLSRNNGNGDDGFPKEDDWHQVLPTGDTPITIRARPPVVVPVDANGEIRGVLLDATTGEPVEGAKVACEALNNHSEKRLGSSAVTDDEGRYRLHVPSPGIYNVWLHEYAKDEWMTAESDDGLFVEAGKSTASQMFLVKARKIVGKLVDSDGKPIEYLVVKCNSAARPESVGVQYFHKMRTKADGSFSFSVPPGRAYLFVDEESRQTKDNTTSGFRSARAYVDASATGDAAPLTLTLQKSATKPGDTQWLKRSTPGTQIIRSEGNQNVTGTVVDETGNPIVEAKVLLDNGAMIATNNNGEFRIETPKSIQLAMHAAAPGYHVWFGMPTSGNVLKIVMEKKVRATSPLEQLVSLKLANTPLIDVLTKACEATDLTVDLDGEALKSVGYKKNMRVTIDVEHVSLRNALTQILKPFDKLSFALENNQVFISTRPRFEASEKAAAPPAGATAAEKPALRITGRVVDAETGKVIDKIRMVPTSVYGDDTKNLTWQSQYLKDFTDGRFLYETDRRWDKTRLRIEAAGYRPAITRVVDKGEVVELEIKLERKILAGVVRLPNGQPAAKAQLALATWTNEIKVEAGQLSYSGHGAKLRQVVETDEQGRFVLPAEIDASVLVVAHAEGYAEQANAETALAGTAPVGSALTDDKPAEDTAVIELHPWGRVEGRLLLIGEPIAGAKYWVYQGRNDDVHVQTGKHIETDAEGRFAVGQLPPGRFGTCQRAADGSDGQSSFALGGLVVRFDVPAGKTITLDLGDPGRTLAGKLALPEGFPHKIDWSKVTLRVAPQTPPFNLRFRTDVTDEAWAAWSKFLQSDEGKTYVREKVAIAADGSFRMEGLPAAEYELSVSALGEAVADDSKPAGQILSGSQKFSVPGVASPEKFQAIDLGPIDLKSLTLNSTKGQP